jgi:hypothetical protein
MDAIKERRLAEIQDQIDAEFNAWVAAQNLNDPALGATLDAMIKTTLAANPSTDWRAAVDAWADRLVREE